MGAAPFWCVMGRSLGIASLTRYPSGGVPPSRSGPARPGHRFLSKRKRWERKGRGCAPGTPQNGGSWRRWAVFGLQEPGLHCRPLYGRLRYRRCRASGGTHRGYPASPAKGCAIPAGPAGPPPVPCLSEIPWCLWRLENGASRMPRPTSSAQATDRSLPGKPESSFPPLGLLSPRRPLRWVAAGAPIFTPAPSGGGVTK